MVGVRAEKSDIARCTIADQHRGVNRRGGFRVWFFRSIDFLSAVQITDGRDSRELEKGEFLSESVSHRRDEIEREQLSL